MYDKHQNAVKGDFKFMEDLLPKEVEMFHMDSYNIEGNVRFQGAFFYNFNGTRVKCDQCPLEILKISRGYQINVCSCRSKDNPHLTWTIWF